MGTTANSALVCLETIYNHVHVLTVAIKTVKISD